MATIPIPKSVKRGVSMLFSGSAFDVAWKLFISGVFVVLIYVLAQMGFFGAALAGVLFSTLLSDDVRSFVADLWTRNFMKV